MTLRIVTLTAFFLPTNYIYARNGYKGSADVFPVCRGRTFSKRGNTVLEVKLQKSSTCAQHYKNDAQKNPEHSAFPIDNSIYQNHHKTL